MAGILLKTGDAFMMMHPPFFIRNKYCYFNFPNHSFIRFIPSSIRGMPVA